MTSPRDRRGSDPGEGAPHGHAGSGGGGGDDLGGGAPLPVVRGLPGRGRDRSAFLLNAAGGAVIAVLLLTWPHWIPAFLTLGFGLSTLGALVLSTTVGLF